MPARFSVGLARNVTKLWCVLSLSLLAGCSATSAYDHPGWWGYISENRSDYTGERIVSMDAAMISNSRDERDVLLGLKWQSGWEDRLAIVVVLTGAITFDAKEPLRVMVDGREMLLPPLKEYDVGRSYQKMVSSGVIEVAQGLVTEKKYSGTFADLSDLLASNSAVLRIPAHHGYIDRRIWPDGNGANASSAYNSTPWLWFRGGAKRWLSVIGASATAK